MLSVVDGAEARRATGAPLSRARADLIAAHRDRDDAIRVAAEASRRVATAKASVAMTDPIEADIARLQGEHDKIAAEHILSGATGQPVFPFIDKLEIRRSELVRAREKARATATAIAELEARAAAAAGGIAVAQQRIADAVELVLAEEAEPLIAEAAAAAESYAIATGKLSTLRATLDARAKSANGAYGSSATAQSLRKRTPPLLEASERALAGFRKQFERLAERLLIDPAATMEQVSP
jgi:hypothetical protein